MSQLCAVGDHVLPVVCLYSNSTWSRPEPASFASAFNETVPVTAAPSAGADIETVGARLSTVTVRAELVDELPTASVVTTRSR